MSEVKTMSSIQFPNTDQPYQVNDARIPADPGAYKYMATDGEGNWVAEDRLAYKEVKETEEILATTNVQFAERNGAYWNTTELPSVDLVRGENYEVIWDGVSYKCTAVDDGYGGEALGNFAAAGATPDTGEPFFFYEENNGEYTEVCAKENREHTISIVWKPESIKRFPEDLMPEGYPYTEVKDGETVLAETTLTNESGAVDNISRPGFGVALIEGKSYKVIFNGSEYVCTAYKTTDFSAENIVVCIGNNKILEHQHNTDTGEPFFVGEWDWGNAYFGWYGNPTCTIEIIELEEIVHPMDAKYLPNPIPAEYLPTLSVCFDEYEERQWSGAYEIGKCTATYQAFYNAFFGGRMGSVSFFRRHSGELFAVNYPVTNEEREKSDGTTAVCFNMPISGGEIHLFEDDTVEIMWLD